VRYIELLHRKLQSQGLILLQSDKMYGRLQSLYVIVLLETCFECMYMFVCVCTYRYIFILLLLFIYTF